MSAETADRLRARQEAKKDEIADEKRLDKLRDERIAAHMKGKRS